MSAYPKAREALSHGDPETALALLAHDASAPAHWLRAVASAHRGETLATRLALRAIDPNAKLPDGALSDVATPYADAILAGTASAAWFVLATRLATELRLEAFEHDTHLAWLIVRAQRDAATLKERGALELRLGLLARRLQNDEIASEHARRAQEIARRTPDAELYIAATCLLAAISHADHDPSLANAIFDHADRQLAVFASDADREAFQDRRHALIAAWASPTP